MNRLLEAETKSRRTFKPKPIVAEPSNGKATGRPELREAITIPAPNIQTAIFKIVGTSPYMQARFAHKAMIAMQEKQMAGSVANKGTKRKARDFDADYEAAKHLSSEGWCGIPAGAFRTAMISACRVIGFKMTVAKLCLFVAADGYDSIDSTPLVRINGKVEKNIGPVRNATGVCDLRARPLWKEWWCDLRVQFDADQFTVTDVANLVARVGIAVGVGECRHDSKQSTGTGFGCFRIDNSEVK